MGACLSLANNVLLGAFALAGLSAILLILLLPGGRLSPCFSHYHHPDDRRSAHANLSFGGKDAAAPLHVGPPHGLM